MNIDTNAILALPVAEKLQLVEMLWDDLGDIDAEIPLPEWMDREAVSRRDQMVANPNLGFSHQETWSRITKPNGLERSLPSAG